MTIVSKIPRMIVWRVPELVPFEPVFATWFELRAMSPSTVSSSAQMGMELLSQSNYRPYLQGQPKHASQEGDSRSLAWDLRIP